MSDYKESFPMDNVPKFHKTIEEVFRETSIMLKNYVSNLDLPVEVSEQLNKAVKLQFDTIYKAMEGVKLIELTNDELMKFGNDELRAELLSILIEYESIFIIFALNFFKGADSISELLDFIQRNTPPEYEAFSARFKSEENPLIFITLLTQSELIHYIYEEIPSDYVDNASFANIGKYKRELTLKIFKLFLRIQEAIIKNREERK